MSLVVGGTFERPEVRQHRLLTTRLVLLGFESDLVIRDLTQVVLTESYRSGYRRETQTDGLLVSAQRSRTLVVIRLPDVQTSTIRVTRVARTSSERTAKPRRPTRIVLVCTSGRRMTTSVPLR